jgi:IS5 family transposase
VEPAIGHLKHDNAMDRGWLMGQTGDALHAVLYAAGYNIRGLLWAIVRLGLKGLFAPLRKLLAWLRLTMVIPSQQENSASGWK